MDSIALIAGKGSLPLYWSHRARQAGHEIYALPIHEEDTAEFEEKLPPEVRVIEVNLGQLDRLINTLKHYELDKVIMIGKVEKSRLFSGLEFDQRMQRVLAGLDVLDDEHILQGVAGELSGQGIEILPQTTFLENLLAGRGLLTAKEPGAGLVADMEYGFRMAREIGRLEIGQTVLVKNRAVLAVEAIEGTDATISRAGSYGGAGVTMAKTSRPAQDLRFDIPAIGPRTLDNLAAIGASGLVVEAGKTFIIEEDEVIDRAEKAGITLMAFEAGEE